MQEQMCHAPVGILGYFKFRVSQGRGPPVGLLLPAAHGPLVTVNHADRLQHVLPTVFFQYPVKIKDRNMFFQAPFVAD